MRYQADAELVGAALDHDQAAVGAIYERYADHIYSFCLSRLRDSDRAADAMQDTFVRAAEGLPSLRDPSRLRAWLFAIARNEIVNQTRGRDRTTTLGTDDIMASDSPDLDANLVAAENAALLWDAAGGLNDRDTELLELQLRYGLDGDELAEALDVTPSHLHVMQSRLRDRIQASLGSLLVARSGRSECADLDMMLGTWDGRFTLDVRSRVTRHIRSCDCCSRTENQAMVPGRAFGVLPLTAVPAQHFKPVLDAMWGALEAVNQPVLPDIPRTSAPARSVSQMWMAGAVVAAASLAVWMGTSQAPSAPPAAEAAMIVSTPGTAPPPLTTTTVIEPVSLTSTTSATTTSSTSTTSTVSAAPSSSSVAVAPAPVRVDSPTPPPSSASTSSSTSSPTSEAPSTIGDPSSTVAEPTTVAPSTSPATTAAPEAGILNVTPVNLALGFESSGEIKIWNDGESPLDWSSSVSGPFLMSAGGTLEPGSPPTTITVTVVPGTPQGAQTGTIDLTANGQTITIDVTATVDSVAPTISSVMASTGTGIVLCAWDDVSVTAIIADQDVDGVSASWTRRGTSESGQSPMIEVISERFVGSFAAFDEPVILDVVVTASDLAGNQTSTALTITTEVCA